jgi:hypothetical protein
MKNRFIKAVWKLSLKGLLAGAQFAGPGLCTQETTQL